MLSEVFDMYVLNAQHSLCGCCSCKVLAVQSGPDRFPDTPYKPEIPREVTDSNVNAVFSRFGHSSGLKWPRSSVARFAGAAAAPSLVAGGLVAKAALKQLLMCTYHIHRHRCVHNQVNILLQLARGMQ